MRVTERHADERVLVTEVPEVHLLPVLLRECRQQIPLDAFNGSDCALLVLLVQLLQKE